MLTDEQPGIFTNEEVINAINPKLKDLDVTVSVVRKYSLNKGYAALVSLLDVTFKSYHLVFLNTEKSVILTLPLGIDKAPEHQYIASAHMLFDIIGDYSVIQ